MVRRSDIETLVKTYRAKIRAIRLDFPEPGSGAAPGLSRRLLRAAQSLLRIGRP